jgi:hypothetical protein
MKESAVFPGPFSVVVASAVAKGHYDTGLIRYEAFRALPRGDQNTNPDWLHQAIELGVSAVTNIALALELQLKILHFQHDGRYPSGHDVSTLGLAFPEPTLKTLRTQYLALRSDPNKPELLTFSFRGGPTENVPEGTWPGEAPTYDDAVRKIGPAYVRWRYIYEKFGETLDVAMSFEHLILLVKTVNYAIGRHPGNTKVSVSNSEPPAKDEPREA